VTHHLVSGQDNHHDMQHSKVHYTSTLTGTLTIVIIHDTFVYIVFT